MIIRGKEGLELCRLKIRYIRDGEEIEQLVGEEGKQWWLNFESKWEHTKIVEFVDIEYTPEQLTRFGEVKSIKASEEILNNYVMEGAFPEGIDHPLRNLQVEKDIANAYFEIMLGGM